MPNLPELIVGATLLALALACNDNARRALPLDANHERAEGPADADADRSGEGGAPDACRPERAADGLCRAELAACRGGEACPKTWSEAQAMSTCIGPGSVALADCADEVHLWRRNYSPESNGLLSCFYASSGELVGVTSQTDVPVHCRTDGAYDGDFALHLGRTVTCPAPDATKCTPGDGQ